MAVDHVFPLRPGTNDAVIYDSVVTRNEYRIPAALAPGAVVLDIGVHVGTFSFLALTRGAHELYGFEPEPSNYARALSNLSPFGSQVRLENQAVWRSDMPAGPLHFWASSDSANTGGGTLIWDTDGPVVNAVPFDSVVDTITRNGERRIDLMKIDCEGAEFPVLLTSKRLGLIDRIVGEYHELRAQLPKHVQLPGCEEFSLEMLVSALEREGFRVETEHQADGKYGKLGIFFAERRIAPPHPGGLTREHVIWAYRLLLDREPESEDVIGPKLAGSANTTELRNHLVTSGEFRDKNPDFAQTNTRTIVMVELEGQPPVRLFVDLADHVIGLGIVRGAYEQDEIAFVRRLLKPGDVVLDVGAHVGFFTMQMAALVGPSGRVYAFEPMSANADLLERSIRENRFADRVELRRGAAGAASGTARLTYPRETLNTGGAFLLSGNDAAPSGHLEAEVSITAIDDLPLKHPVRFIKMDVEGAEPQVLRGAERLLQADRPVILTEVHPSQLDRASGVSVSAFFEQLGALGYEATDTVGNPVAASAIATPRTVIFVPRPAK